MKKELSKFILKTQKRLQTWTNSHVFGIFIFNIILMMLLLLYTAGYFHPFFQLSINLIFLISMVLSIFLLSLSSKAFFVIGALFWIIAGFFRFFNVEIWAERTAIYTYQALVIGIVLLIFENIKTRSR